MSEPVSEKLDRVAALLALANREAIAQAKTEIREDQLSSAIIDNCPPDWTAGPDIWKKIPKSAKTASARTFNRRLGDLVSEGALYRQGKGAGVKYRPTGLV